MGSTFALVIGSDVESQLAPYKATDDALGTHGLYYFFWQIGPIRYANWTDWRYAFRLRDGHAGEPRFLSGDEPSGLTYSAIKRAIAFDTMYYETRLGAGQVWDFAREIGIPEGFARYANRLELPSHEEFAEQLDRLLQEAYPAIEGYQFAYANFFDAERLLYSRDRYIDLRFKARIAQGNLIENGVLSSFSEFLELTTFSSPILQWDSWLDHVSRVVDALPGDTLLSKVFLKQ
jgi:hypothetical protein